MQTPSDNSHLFPATQPLVQESPSLDQRADWTKIPAKMAVYLLAAPAESLDEPDKPVLLATVGDLRAALKRRLADPSPPSPDAPIATKRIPYGRLCHRVPYRIVHSPFAANWFYWQAARTLFPQRYREMIVFRPAWWIGLERDVVAAKFPKLRRTQSLDDSSLLYAGPIRDKTAAGKLIELVEDLFDLCRYQNILVQAPHGKACAYKEMGKCPAPCDGSVPLEWYYAAIKAAFGFITGDSRDAFFSAQQAAMTTAAAAQAFEKAQKIKQRLNRAAAIHQESYAHLAPLDHFALLALQPGQGKPYIEPFLIHGGSITQLPQLHKKTLASDVQKLFKSVQSIAGAPISLPVDSRGIDQMALVSHHLYRDEDAGVYLPLHTLTSRESLLTAAQNFLARKYSPKPLMEQSSEPAAEANASPPASSSE